jgi:hypothetical protein
MSSFLALIPMTNQQLSSNQDQSIDDQSIKVNQSKQASKSKQAHQDQPTNQSKINQNPAAWEASLLDNQVKQAKGNQQITSGDLLNNYQWHMVEAQRAVYWVDGNRLFRMTFKR